MSKKANWIDGFLNGFGNTLNISGNRVVYRTVVRHNFGTLQDDWINIGIDIRRASKKADQELLANARSK